VAESYSGRFKVRNERWGPKRHESLSTDKKWALERDGLFVLWFVNVISAKCYVFFVGPKPTC
jgi:hypothetical protein